MDIIWKCSTMCWRHWYWWLKLNQHRYKAIISGCSRSQWYQNHWACGIPLSKHTASKGCLIPNISLCETSIRGSEFHQWITGVARDSNVKATKDQKTCLLMCCHPGVQKTRHRALTFTPKYHRHRHVYVCSCNLGEHQRTQASVITSAR